MKERAAEYRSRLEELRRAGGARWRTPSSLREEIVAWVTKLRAEGHGTRSMAAAIGMSESALGRWLSQRETEGQLRRVEVVAGATPDLARRLVVVTPGGYRLEGLSVDEAVSVLRRL